MNDFGFSQRNFANSRIDILAKAKGLAANIPLTKVNGNELLQIVNFRTIFKHFLKSCYLCDHGIHQTNRT